MSAFDDIAGDLYRVKQRNAFGGWDFRSDAVTDRFVRLIDNDGQIRVLLMVERSEVIAGEVIIAHLSEAGMVDMAITVIEEMFALVGEDEA